MIAYYPVTNGTTAGTDGYFEIPGNFTNMFTAGFKFVATDSGSGSPSISSVKSFNTLSSSFISDHTRIVPDVTSSPTELVPSGYWVSIMGGAYAIQSDVNGSFEIGVGVINQSDCSLALPGRAVLNYGELINQALFSLLENFAGPTEPLNPNIGQLWYDTNTNTLKVYNGSSFVAV